MGLRLSVWQGSALSLNRSLKRWSCTPITAKSVTASMSKASQDMRLTDVVLRLTERLTMVEEVRLTIPKRESVNRNKVPLKQWRKWNVAARKVFNETYGTMRKNQWAFLHPKQDKVSPQLWRTVAWNAAWIAADAL